MAKQTVTARFKRTETYYDEIELEVEGDTPSEAAGRVWDQYDAGASSPMPMLTHYGGDVEGWEPDTEVVEVEFELEQVIFQEEAE